MPFVNPNRVYQVRSAPRQATAAPIHTVALPDVAGAYHNAMMPGLQAGLQASRDELRTRQALNNQRTALVQNLIGLGGKIATTALSSYERAAERRDALAVQRAESAYVAHMNDADAAAEASAYDPGGEGRAITGPATVIRDRERAFDETDVYKALTDSQRQAFEERRAVRQGVYFNRADRLHNQKRLAFNQEQADLRAKNDLDAVQRFAYDPGSDEDWANQVDIAIESDQERRRVALRLSERPDPTPTPAEQVQLDTARLAMRNSLAAARLETWVSRIAADADPAEGAHPLVAEIEARLGAGIDPAQATAIRADLAKAVERRETTRAACDRDSLKNLDNALLAWEATFDEQEEADDQDPDSALDQIAAGGTFRSESARREAGAKLAAARDLASLRRWQPWLDDVRDRAENGTIEDRIEAEDAARKALASITSPEMREKAAAALHGLHKQITDEEYDQLLFDAEYGWSFGSGDTRSLDSTFKRYHDLLPTLDRKRRTKFAEAARKRLEGRSLSREAFLADAAELGFTNAADVLGPVMMQDPEKGLGVDTQAFNRESSGGLLDDRIRLAWRRESGKETSDRFKAGKALIGAILAYGKAKRTAAAMGGNHGIDLAGYKAAVDAAKGKFDEASAVERINDLTRLYEQRAAQAMLVPGMLEIAPAEEDSDQ